MTGLDGLTAPELDRLAHQRHAVAQAPLPDVRNLSPSDYSAARSTALQQARQGKAAMAPDPVDARMLEPQAYADAKAAICHPWRR